MAEDKSGYCTRISLNQDLQLVDPFGIGHKFTRDMKLDEFEVSKGMSGTNPQPCHDRNNILSKAVYKGSLHNWVV